MKIGKFSAFGLSRNRGREGGRACNRAVSAGFGQTRIVGGRPEPPFSFLRVRGKNSHFAKCSELEAASLSSSCTDTHLQKNPGRME